MTLRQVGVYPTPYGVSVPVFEHPSDKEAVLFDGEATAICCGIFDEKERRRFVDFAKFSGGRFDLASLESYGGRKLLSVPLPRPGAPVFPQITETGSLGLDDQIEAFVTLVMDRHRWCDRAERILEAVEVNFEHPVGLPVMNMALTLALQLIMTGALEHVSERRIECLEAAALYALTTHETWKNAGLAWLEPVRTTWFRQWVQSRPTYRLFATRCREDTDLPEWIAGD